MMTKTNSLLTGLVAGALLGAVAGLLVAPKAGKETRTIVGTKAAEVRSRAEDYFGNIKDRVRREREETQEHSDNGVHTHG
jgi:gas vesicle protein